MKFKMIIDESSPNLPALEGSPKQIEWAKTIRSKFIAWANARPDFRVIGAAETVAIMKGADFWITHRRDYEFLRSFCTEQDPDFDINTNAVGERVCKFTDPLAEVELQKHLANLPKTITE